jgi:predicted HTH transcriptional regulator
MIYQPIQSSRDFQNRILLGSTKESVHLDFKAQLNSEEPPKIAVDMAAFANTLGGTLLIGVSEKQRMVLLLQNL